MAERGFSSTIYNALSSQQADLAILVYLDWPGGTPVRVWTGVGPKTFGGNTYTGVGTLGSIDKVTDSTDKSDIGIELSFNYLDDTLRNAIIATDPIGRAASIFMAAITTSTGVIADAYEMFAGFMDEIVIEDGGTSGRIVVRVASELARLGRPMTYQYTDAHQQTLFSGDLGMQFAPKMNEPIIWGRKTFEPFTPNWSDPGAPYYVPWPPKP